MRSPAPRALSKAEVLGRIEARYGASRRHAVQQKLVCFRQQPDRADQLQRLLDRYRKRMYDISIFIKELLTGPCETPGGF
jgi:hypothetical protein